MCVRGVKCGEVAVGWRCSADLNVVMVSHSLYDLL